MIGKLTKAPCGHDGETIIGTYVKCLTKGCDGSEKTAARETDWGPLWRYLETSVNSGSSRHREDMFRAVVYQATLGVPPSPNPGNFVMAPEGVLLYRAIRRGLVEFSHDVWKFRLGDSIFNIGSISIPGRFELQAQGLDQVKPKPLGTLIQAIRVVDIDIANQSITLEPETEEPSQSSDEEGEFWITVGGVPTRVTIS